MKLSTMELLCLPLLGFACAAPPPPPPPVDLTAEQAAVTIVLDQFDQVWVEEDLDLLSRIFAHDPDMVTYGTDEAEVFVGYDALQASIAAQLEAYTNTRLSTRERVVHVHADGKVAWFSQLWDGQTETAGETVSVGMRLSGVLEKRDGAWVFVQYHASVPVVGQAFTY